MTQIVDYQVLLERFQRTPRNDDIRRAVGSKQQQLCRPAAARQRRNKIQRGWIHPVKVFQQQDQRRLRRNGFLMSRRSLRTMRSRVAPMVSFSNACLC